MEGEPSSPSFVRLLAVTATTTRLTHASDAEVVATTDGRVYAEVLRVCSSLRCGICTRVGTRTRLHIHILRDRRRMEILPRLARLLLLRHKFADELRHLLVALRASLRCGVHAKSGCDSHSQRRTTEHNARDGCALQRITTLVATAIGVAATLIVEGEHLSGLVQCEIARSQKITVHNLTFLVLPGTIPRHYKGREWCRATEGVICYLFASFLQITCTHRGRV